MNILEMGERMSALSKKHGWEDGDVLSEEETSERIEIILKEEPDLWDFMKKDAQEKATRHLMGA
jgi:hypothetical protein